MRVILQVHPSGRHCDQVATLSGGGSLGRGALSPRRIARRLILAMSDCCHPDFDEQVSSVTVRERTQLQTTPDSLRDIENIPQTRLPSVYATAQPALVRQCLYGRTELPRMSHRFTSVCLLAQYLTRIYLHKYNA